MLWDEASSSTQLVDFSEALLVDSALDDGDAHFGRDVRASGALLYYVFTKQSAGAPDSTPDLSALASRTQGVLAGMLTTDGGRRVGADRLADLLALADTRDPSAPANGTAVPNQDDFAIGRAEFDDIFTRRFPPSPKPQWPDPDRPDQRPSPTGGPRRKRKGWWRGTNLIFLLAGLAAVIQKVIG